QALFWLYISVVTAAVFGLYFWNLVDVVTPFILGDDSAQYVLLSRAILHGDGYRSIWMDGAPLHVKFPFGLPVLLALAASLGNGWGPLFLVPVISAAGAVFMIFWAMRERAGAPLAWGIAVLTGATSLMYLYSRSLLSETPFLFFLMAVLFFADRFLRSDDPGWRDALCLVFFMLGAFFLRTVGGCLVVAFIVMLLRGSQWRVRRLKLTHQVVAGLIIVPICVWMAASFMQPKPVDDSYLLLLAKYIDPVKEVLGAGSMGGAAMTFVKGVYALFFYAIPSALTSTAFSSRTWLAALISAAAVLGWVISWRKRPSVTEAFCVFYLLGLAVWPWVQSSGTRMVLPIVPLLFYYIFVAVRSMASHTPWKKAGAVLVVAAFCVLMTAGFGRWRAPVAAPVTHDAGLGMQKAFIWIRQATPGQALFLSPVPATLYLYTQRRSVSGSPLYGLSDDEVRALILAGAIDYIFDPQDVPWQRSVMGPLHEKLERVYDIDGQKVYKVKRD
ncbi:MAG: glycosyltransferase family 39 protein, partial [Candidatus Omnitrophica bacterium]|nr:glycosyltransferase family 39 protein [Candidatus Omnitrophota bacterium]